MSEADARAAEQADRVNESDATTENWQESKLKWTEKIVGADKEIHAQLDKIREMNKNLQEKVDQFNDLDGGKIRKGWERVVTEDEIDMGGKKVTVQVLQYKEKRVELAGDEYVNVWDSCGIRGYLIPWANWKAQGILPISDRKRFVDTKFVNLLARESVGQGSFDSAANGMPIVFLDDVKGQSWDGINWDAVRVAVVKAARSAGCVMKVVPRTPYEEVVTALDEVTREYGRMREFKCAIKDQLERERENFSKSLDMIYPLLNPDVDIRKLVDVFTTAGFELKIQLVPKPKSKPTSSPQEKHAAKPKRRLTTKRKPKSKKRGKK